MNRKTLLFSALISSVIAMLTAAAVFLVLFSRFGGGDKMVDPPGSFGEKSPTPTPKIESPPIPNEEVKAADAEALTIETVYKNFFAEGDKCRQTYSEYFKTKDGFGSPSSPCSVKLTVNRDGSAEKTIEVRRYDRDSKQWQTVEKNTWKAKLAPTDFEALAETIVNNQAFKSWHDGIMINVSNCTISVRHRKGTKSPMSNVDETATAYLPMVNAFKALDAKADWK